MCKGRPAKYPDTAMPMQRPKQPMSGTDQLSRTLCKKPASGGPIAVTRKNFLFLGSEAGGDRATVLYSVLETAKLNGLDPEAYLADVIDRMAKGRSINRLVALLPWN
jgi:hypothetical protein